MVVLSPALAGMTALLALAGSSAVDAAPATYQVRGGSQRKYQQPRAALSGPLKVAQPAWALPFVGSGEQRFAANKPRRAHRSDQYQKRSEPAQQPNNCKRDNGSTGPASIPGYVTVYQQTSSAVPYDQTKAGSAATVGNIVVHTIFSSPSSNLTNSTVEPAGAGSSKAKNVGKEKNEDGKQETELQSLDRLDATATNYTLQASQYGRTLLYIVPTDATEQQQLGEIIQGAENGADLADVIDSDLDSVTVNLVVPLINGTATAQNWCATFATAPPAPLHLEPCTYAPGYAGEKSSQRFQYSPFSGSLLPLFIQEHAGAVATGSWGNATKHRNHTETGRQTNQVLDTDADSDTDIVAYTMSNQGSSFAVSHDKTYLDLTFVAAASHPPLPTPGCDPATSAAPVSQPSSTSASSGSGKSRSGRKSNWGSSTALPSSSASATHHSGTASKPAESSVVSSTIGSLKPTRHSHYTAPKATATKTITVTNGQTMTITEFWSPSVPVASSSSSSNKKKPKPSSSVESSSSLASEGWESASSWVPVSTSSASKKPKSKSESKAVPTPSSAVPSSATNQTHKASSSVSSVKSSSTLPTSSPVDPEWSHQPSSASSTPASSVDPEWSHQPSSASSTPVSSVDPEWSHQPSSAPSSSRASPTVSPVDPQWSHEPSSAPSPTVSPVDPESQPVVTSPAAGSGAGSGASTLWAVPV